MAQDPDQQQPGNEEHANDQPMAPAPTAQEIEIATQHYLQMKQGMDKRINAYAITRNELMAMTVRNLEKWVQSNCESVEKLVKKKATKPLKVDLILVAIGKQRVWDLNLLKTCRNDAISIGVPENKLPWTYGELDDGEKKKDEGKVPAAEEKVDDNKDGKKKKKVQGRNYDEKIDWVYAQLEEMKEERRRQSNMNGNGNGNGNGNVPYSAPDSANGSGTNNNGNGNAMKQNQLKQTIMQRMQGQKKRIPAKDVS